MKLNFVSQNKAVDSISNSIISSIATQSFKSKPILSSLLVGPTGTGKTYLTELIAKELGLKIQLIDMTSFKTPGAVNKFIELQTWFEKKEIPVFGHISVGIFHPCFNKTIFLNLNYK